MKNPLANLLCAVFIITGVLLLELGTPVPGLGKELCGGVVTKNVNLRKAPSLQGSIISGLQPGSQVKIYEEKDGWYRVSTQKYHQVFNGWVSIAYVKIAVAETTATPPVIAVPEKPLPTPVEKTPPPEAKAPAVSLEPQPDKRVAAEPPKTKITDTKARRSPRVAKTPVPDAGPEPADGLIRLLPTALPVLAVIVLLIVVIAYRVRRASGTKAEIPDAPAEPAPAGWPPPAAENSSLELELEENGPIEEDLPADFEFQMESMPEDEDWTSGDDGDGPTKVGSVSDDGDGPTKVGSVSDDGDSPTKDVPVYDLVVEKINRMSDGELVELRDLVDDQLGAKSREDDRLIFYTTVDYVVEGQYYRDFIQDLSVSGVFIKARQMFEPGQQILMTFMSPFLQKPFKISGEIVRTLNTGIGVSFDKGSQVQTEAISALMDQIRMFTESG